MTSLSGRRALVCGSSQGIGRASAEALAAAGAEVVLLARNETQLRSVRDALSRPSGATHEVLVADFGDPDHVGKVVTEYLGANPSFQILINNTGGPPPGTALDASLDAFRAAFAMHLFCNHVLVQAAVPGMRAAGYGRIINIVSTSVREPIKGLGVSNTVRAATAGWAKTLSKELSPFGITVNNILPGSTRTGRLEMLLASRAKAADTSIDTIEASLTGEIPVGRFAEPEEIAAAVAFLASPAASYINGVNLPVDGGRMASI